MSFQRAPSRLDCLDSSSSLSDCTFDTSCLTFEGRGSKLIEGCSAKTVRVDDGRGYCNCFLRLRTRRRQPFLIDSGTRSLIGCRNALITVFRKRDDLRRADLRSADGGSSYCCICRACDGCCGPVIGENLSMLSVR